MDNDWWYRLIKSVGKVSQLSAKIAEAGDLRPMWYTMGIAHTRRATHGEPSLVNTHPHCDRKEDFFVVHNGIIENQRKLKTELEQHGYTFYSETDSEVVPALLSHHRNGNFIETVEKVLPLLHGAYALLIVSKHLPDEMIAIKRWSPLIFGTDNTGKDMYFSSDIQALSGYAEYITHIKDGELVHIQWDRYTIKTEWTIVNKALEVLKITSMETSKGDYDHYMLKEMYEQPAVINRIFRGRVDFSDNSIHTDAFHWLDAGNIEKVVLVWCGTSYNAAQSWALRLQDLWDIDAHAEIASEYIHKRIDHNPTTLHIFLSQSGETADTIEVLNLVKEKWGSTFGIVNVVWSSIARLTDRWLFMRAWFEIGVASTKAFTAQLTCLLIFALFVGKKKNLSYTKYNQLLKWLQEIPKLIDSILEQSDDIKEVAKEFTDYEHMFFLGRHYQMPLADEWSLKLKEISYIHSESYPAGELKHWPLAIIQDDVPTLLFAPNDQFFDQNMSSMEEVKARKGKVLVVTDQHKVDADRVLMVPSTLPELYPFLTCVVSQLFAYHVANKLERDIDKPRNLAKSVTVK